MKISNQVGPVHNDLTESVPQISIDDDFDSLGAPQKEADIGGTSKPNNNTASAALESRSIPYKVESLPAQ